MYTIIVLTVQQYFSLESEMFTSDTTHIEKNLLYKMFFFCIKNELLVRIKPVTVTVTRYGSMKYSVLAVQTSRQLVRRNNMPVMG